MKYTADPQHNGMYVCLDPVQEKDFTEGLTVKIGSDAEKSLSGEGMHGIYLKYVYSTT